jgi:hypothetical protein
LIDLAVEGADLRVQLHRNFTMVSGLRRIQILTARSALFLPLELVLRASGPRR